MLNDTKDFKVRQFGCNHCYSNGIQQETIDKIQELKDLTGCDIFIVGAYRCKVHNKNLSGGNNYYTRGLAVDFRMADKKGNLMNGPQMAEILEETEMLDDCCIVTHQSFITIELGGEYERISKI